MNIITGYILNKEDYKRTYGLMGGSPPTLTF